MKFVIINIIMSICTATMILHGLIWIYDDNNEDGKRSKKSMTRDFIACFTCLLIAFFVLFHYVTMEINKQVNDKINELKEELNIETTTTTTTTIPTTIIDDNGNVYVLQPTTENN